MQKPSDARGIAGAPPRAEAGMAHRPRHPSRPRRTHREYATIGALHARRHLHEPEPRHPHRTPRARRCTRRHRFRLDLRHLGPSQPGDGWRRLASRNPRQRRPRRRAIHLRRQTRPTGRGHRQPGRPGHDHTPRTYPLARLGLRPAGGPWPRHRLGPGRPRRTGGPRGRAQARSIFIRRTSSTSIRGWDGNLRKR